MKTPSFFEKNQINFTVEIVFCGQMSVEWNESENSSMNDDDILIRIEICFFPKIYFIFEHETIRIPNVLVKC